MNADFPRTIRVGRWVLGSYKVCLFAGIYFGVVASALAAWASGVTPGAMALATLACACAGLIGARLFHLAVFAARYRGTGLSRVWDTTAGGGGLFGGLCGVALAAPAAAAWLGLPSGVFWDHLIFALLVGAVWTRVGCFCNGCCGGRGTTSRIGLRWPRGDAETRRVPVQLLEIAWVLLALVAVGWLFPRPHTDGSLALGSIAWYGLGRFFLEPFRAAPDIVCGAVRINQVIAAAVAIIAAALLLRG